jgi:hypothetical protein
MRAQLTAEIIARQLLRDEMREQIARRNTELGTLYKQQAVDAARIEFLAEEIRRLKQGPP